ncbi:unnamed protein product, partial [Rotaria magnacalcarata]
MAKSNPTTTSTSAPTSTATFSSIPALHAFDSRSTTWQSYRDRINFYFKANRIVHEDDKKALFLWSVGDSTYSLLESLVSPRLLTDESSGFNDLVKLLDVHYDATKNIMTSTYDFYSCHQKPGQPFAEWKAELCEKLRYCGFTTSVLATKSQDRALRDMYVIGTNNPKIRQALLKEQDPDLEKAEKIIQIAERLEQDVLHFGNSCSVTNMSVAKIEQKKTYAVRSPLPVKASSKIIHPPCQSCGSTNHLRSNCKFREFVCNSCQRSGHLARVCRQNKQVKKPGKHIQTSSLKYITHRQQPSTGTATISLHVNGQDCTFEIDTGAYNTIVSTEIWKRLGSPRIRPSALRMECYSGQLLQIKGECNVNVDYEGHTYNLIMIVVHDAGSSLLGLQWIVAMQIDLNHIVHGSSYVQRTVHKIYNQTLLQEMLEQYKKVFDAGLGLCNKVQAHIQLKPNAVPKFFKPRPIAFAYLAGVKDEIQRNVEAGILERVDTATWAAPIVPIRKPNGKIRICGDFKVTINSQILIDQHPIPSIDELLTHLNNGEKFTKLDLSDAYLQVELDEESKKLVVINTPMGLFRYNRMPFGIANAPAIFQRLIEQVISGIPLCVAYLDDILITGVDEKAHFKTLDMVLSRLAAFGFKCNMDKCSFFQDEVSYLGYIISKHGKRPDQKRVEAIQNLPTPNDVKQLEAFVGKINYYGKFISNFSTVCAPLNRLRQKNVKWMWTLECQQAFNTLKQQLCEATTLVHFDAQLPLILATDASNYGIGAVIMHRYSDGAEKPIAHASKTLSVTEKNYSQIEKEALSIIYGVRKFHQYLAGRSFELITDHRPLLTIFNPAKGIPISTANRLQRWAISLMGYTYTIRYKPTRDHANADALSRLPAGPDDTFVDQEALQINYIQSQIMEEYPVDADLVQLATGKDEILQLVKKFTLTKWPNSFSKKQHPELIPYYNHRNELSVVNGCLLKDVQVIIPKALQHKILQLLHRAHLGTVKMKQLARGHCWWPQMDKEISSTTNSCHICVTSATMPKEEFKPWPEPSDVWSRVHMDFAGPIWGSKWFIMIDAKSRFPFVADMGSDTTAKALCAVLEQAIDWLGPPETLVSDNGPPFNSYEMKSFYNKYGIQHVTTAPYHPASNGIAERFVRSFKEGMMKEQKTLGTTKNVALRRVLRSYRWTPHTITGISPADMLLQRSIRTELVRLKPKLSKEKCTETKFYTGQLVWAVNPQLNKRPQWQAATVKRNLGSMVYEVQLENGQTWKRHQNQLRSRCELTDQSSDLDSLP